VVWLVRALVFLLLVSPRRCALLPTNQPCRRPRTTNLAAALAHPRAPHDSLHTDGPSPLTLVCLCCGISTRVRGTDLPHKTTTAARTGAATAAAVVHQVPATAWGQRLAAARWRATGIGATVGHAQAGGMITPGRLIPLGFIPTDMAGFLTSRIPLATSLFKRACRVPGGACGSGVSGRCG
jgi:hypothetical protein